MPDLKERLQRVVGDSYRIEAELGGGGMSRVFMADEVQLHRRVVIKVLPPEMSAGVNQERFLREIQLAASLQHPHIVPVLTADSGDDLLYYVMPYIEGESLRAKLSREGELPVGEVVRILKEVADALSYAHSQDIVHRDIKPDNVLLSRRHALVTDFGVAKAVSASTGESSLTSLGVALGTPAYMAPEQAAASPNVDHRADLYALGALAYEMLAGEPPFTGSNPQAVLAAHVSQMPEPVTARRPAVPTPMSDLVMRCLEKRAADRWQTADQLLPQLEAMTTPSGGTTPTGTAPYPAAPSHARHVHVGGIFALSAMAVFGLVYFLTMQLGLPDWVLPASIVLLIIGFPIIVFTGHLERRRAIAHTTGLVSAPQEGGVHGWFTWRKAITGGVMAFAGLGVVASGYAAMRVLGIGPAGTLVASGILESRGTLVLADFDNRTTDSTLGPSVTEALRVDLAQSPVVRLLDRGAVAAAFQRMNRPPGTHLNRQLAIEMAEREGARAVVAGEIGQVGAGFVVSAEIVSTDDQSVLLALRETADDDTEIIRAIDQLSGRLRERIGESLKSIRGNEPLDRVTTSSLDALRKYTQALRADLEGDPDRTIPLLEDAIGRDTTFAMAYRKLAAMLDNVSAEQSRVMAAARKAFEYRDRLPELERYLATAEYYGTVEPDPARLIDAYQSALELDPEDLTSLNNLAQALSGRREFEEAERLALRATGLGDFWQFYGNALIAQVGQGNFAAAETTIARLQEKLPESPQTTRLQAWLKSAQRDYEAAEALASSIAASRRDPFWQSWTSFMLFSIDQAQGRLREAEGHLRTDIAIDEQAGRHGSVVEGVINLALMDIDFRDAPADGLLKVEAALEQYPLNAIPAADRPYTLLAYFYARADRTDEAKRLLGEGEAQVNDALWRSDPLRHEAAATVALAEGRVQDAIAGYRAFYDEAGCGVCGLFELARAYEQASEADSALAVYERAVTTPSINRVYEERTTLAPTYKRLGELYEERGDTERAASYYNNFVDLWQDADAELQPVVGEVRGRVARLAGEAPGGR